MERIKLLNMICVIDCGTSYLNIIKNIVKKFGYAIKTIKVKEISKCDFQSFSGIIITGAPINLTEIDLKKYLANFKLIKKIKIPMLGICLGHQIIGALYGAKISRGKMIDKNEHIKILKKDKLFLDIKNNDLFKEEHQEYADLPKDFSLLAKSDSCRNEAMKHKRKTIYGTQFHPEVSGNNGAIVLKNFLRMC